MADPNLFDPIRIPIQTLVAMDWRPYHFAIQPYHFLVRMAHLLTMAAFFGGVALLDLRLLGLGMDVPLRALTRRLIPWLYGSFALCTVTGIALFFYDPVHAGSRAYWTPKLIAIGLALANVGLFHRRSYARALAAEGHMPHAARLAGAASLLCWTAVVVFACLNTEAAPKVFLR